MAVINPAPMPVGEIVVNGSDDLIRRVGLVQAADRANGSPPGKPPTRVPELAPLGLARQVFRSSDVLSFIGALSTPPNVLRGPFAAAAAWAWVRYQWAFASGNGLLTPTADALSLKRHHRTTLSEHMGIGFGLSLVESILKSRYPGASVEFHDVDFVISGLVPMFVVAGVSSRRPDYIAEVTSQAGRSVLYLVECKGRHGWDGRAAERQLARALTQVEGLTVNGRIVPSFVVATQVDRRGFEVLAADPEGEPPSFERSLTVQSSRSLDRSSWDKTKKVDVELEYLTRRLPAVKAARLLLEAGEVEYAGDLLGELPPQQARREVVDFEYHGRVFRGERMEFPVLGSRFVAFRGADAQRIETIKRGSSLGVESRSAPVDIHRAPTANRPADELAEARPDDAGVLIGVGTSD